MKISKLKLRRLIFSSLSEAISTDLAPQSKTNDSDTDSDKSNTGQKTKSKKGKKTFEKVTISYTHSNIKLEKGTLIKGIIHVVGQGEDSFKGPVIFTHAASKKGTNINRKYLGAKIKIANDNQIKLQQSNKIGSILKKLKKAVGESGFRYFKIVMKKYAGLIVNRNNTIVAKNRILSRSKIKVQESNMKLTRKQLNTIIHDSLINENFFGGVAKAFGQGLKSAVRAPGQALDMMDALKDAQKKYPDAYKIYYAMHGGIGFGTDEKTIEQVIKDRTNDLNSLYEEYENLMNDASMDVAGKKIRLKEDDLIKQLIDDGMKEEAEMIEVAIQYGSASQSLPATSVSEPPALPGIKI